MAESLWPTTRIEEASKDPITTLAAALIIAETDRRPLEEMSAGLADMLADVRDKYELHDIDHVQAALFMAAPNLGLRDLFN